VPHYVVAYSRRTVTTMSWRPILIILPLALLIDAVVAYFGWAIWKSMLALW
jgi:hypothetical protein